MFIEREDLGTAIEEYKMAGIDVNDSMVRSAILAAIGEMSGYLSARYDTGAIFSAEGDRRDPLVKEHCVSIAVWYLLRRSNADIIFEKTRDYYKAAVEWLKLVAGIGGVGSIAPALPLRKDENGETRAPMRMGSNPKFRHTFDD